MQGAHHFGEGFVLAAHVEHLEYRRVGTVVAVLGPPFGLGDPHRLAVLADRVVDVGGERLVGGELLAPAAQRTVHDEALVQAHQVADEGFLQQVVADGDARGRQAGVVHGVVDEGRVHHDIAVVGDEQVGAAWLEAIDPGVGDAIGGLLDGVVDVGLELVLQRGDAADAGDLAGQAMGYKRFEQPTEGTGQAREAVADQGAEEGVVAQEALQYRGDFGVTVGSDGFELAHHAFWFHMDAAKAAQGGGRKLNRAIINGTHRGCSDARKPGL